MQWKSWYVHNTVVAIFFCIDRSIFNSIFELQLLFELHILCSSNLVPFVFLENASNFTSYKSRFTNSTRSLQSSATTFSNLYYSFDYGPIHFIAISSEHDFKLQTLWMERDLSKVDRNKTPFVIFYTHRPMYSSNENHGSYEPLRTQVEFILRKYNIDLALYGHVHAYGKCSSGV